jgi:hypothetical protein
LRRRFAAQIEQMQTENPELAENLKKRITSYENYLHDFGVSPEHLSVSSHSTWYVFRYFLLRLGIILFLLPIIIIGAVIHLPAYLLCLLLAKIFRRHGPDESGGTIKILAAMFLMPVTWLAISLIIFFQWNWQAAVIAFPVSIICGYIALRSLEELYDLRGWFNAALVLLRKPQQFIRLLIERRVLHREITAITNR